MKDHLGKSETARDRLTSRLIDSFQATLGPCLFADTKLPLMLHWCLCPPIAAMDGLGEDGHPRKGGFLPPIALLRRMWAGGHIAFHAPFTIDADVERHSRVASIEEKSGKSGDLAFVGVDHDYRMGERLCVSERHLIVYREAASLSPKHSEPPAAKADLTLNLEATSTLLFRYSALTWNGHRIHYDADYAREVEGYQGLVIHGPLQATLMVHAAARLAGRVPVRFDYRARSPLIAPQNIRIHAAWAGDAIVTWTEGENGLIGMAGEARF